MEYITEANRIYAENDGKLVAEITFPSESGAAIIERTFVDDSLRGQGVASKLVEMAVTEIKSRGMEVKASCSYAEKWLEKNL